MFFVRYVCSNIILKKFSQIYYIDDMAITVSIHGRKLPLLLRCKRNLQGHTKEVFVFDTSLRKRVNHCSVQKKFNERWYYSQGHLYPRNGTSGGEHCYFHTFIAPGVCPLGFFFLYQDLFLILFLSFSRSPTFLRPSERVLLTLTTSHLLRC